MGLTKQLIAWSALNVDRRALSAFDEWDGPTQLYEATYRSNTGLYRVTRRLRAPSIKQAEEVARAAIPKRKATDIFWLVLWELSAVE